MECVICMSNYTKENIPRALLCGHTFCDSCLQNMVQDNGIICPNCRRITVLSDRYQEPINFTNFLIPNLTLMKALLIETYVKIPKTMRITLVDQLNRNLINRALRDPLARYSRRYFKLKFIQYLFRTIIVLLMIGYLAILICFIIGFARKDNLLNYYLSLFVCELIGYSLWVGEIIFMIMLYMLDEFGGISEGILSLAGILTMLYMTGINIWATVDIFSGINEGNTLLFYTLIVCVCHKAGVFLMFIPAKCMDRVEEEVNEYENDIIFLEVFKKYLLCMEGKYRKIVYLINLIFQIT